MVVFLAKRMPVKRVYTPELLLKMLREMEAGEKFRELETERLVVTKVHMFAVALHCPVKVKLTIVNLFVYVGRLCRSSGQRFQVGRARPTPSIRGVGNRVRVEVVELASLQPQWNDIVSLFLSRSDHLEYSIGQSHTSSSQTHFVLLRHSSTKHSKRSQGGVCSDVARGEYPFG